MALDQVVSALKEASADFTALNVRTFVGRIDIETEDTGDPKWDELMKSAKT